MPIIKDNVKNGSKLYSDELYAKSDLGKWYEHEIVNHSIKQYAKKNAKGDKVSTNSIESVWNHFKNPIHGTYHNNIDEFFNYKHVSGNNCCGHCIALGVRLQAIKNQIKLKEVDKMSKVLLNTPPKKKSKKGK